MGILDNYLQELFGIGNSPEKQLEKIGFVDPNDKSLPNPYNFRQLKLVTPNKADIQKAEVEWKKIRDKGWETSENTFQEIYKVSIEQKKHGAQLYTIIDRGKRVGIVGFHRNSGITNIHNKPGGNIIYVTWVHGKNYAAAGTMKLLNLPSVPQYGIKDKKLNLMRVEIEIHTENKASVSIVRNLKATPSYRSEYDNTQEYIINAPYWWNNNKLLKHKK
jgi:RimJ/RimL family protein N-acetyltransferase